MKITGELIDGNLVERPNRFLGIVNTANGLQQAFIPNPGRMEELLIPGSSVKLQQINDNRKRKTEYDLVASFHNNRWISIDTRVPNMFVNFLLKKDSLPHFKGYKILKAEVKYKNSRFDFLLESKSGKICYVEVKSCTLVENRIALFPDAPTKRGQKHAIQLAKLLNEGYRCAMLFIVQRDDADMFAPNDKTDPDFANEFFKAKSNGLEMFALSSRMIGCSLEFVKEIPVVLDNE